MFVLIETQNNGPLLFISAFGHRWSGWKWIATRKHQAHVFTFFLCFLEKLPENWLSFVFLLRKSFDFLYVKFDPKP